MPALGWAFFSLVLAQILGVMGWGDWFPWSVPVMLSGMFGPDAAKQIGTHSFTLVTLGFIIGVIGTITWWRSADHTR